jgi:hypothetical protein
LGAGFDLVLDDLASPPVEAEPPSPESLFAGAESLEEEDDEEEAESDELDSAELFSRWRFLVP